MNCMEEQNFAETDEVEYSTHQAELLSWHYRLGHISFGQIQRMAERGDLPAYLTAEKKPLCASCQYKKQTKRLWRTKALVNAMTTPPATAPGSVVGVDQLISSTLGLIGKIRGMLTRQWYTVTTVFIDHYSGLSYVHFQMSTAAADTI